MTADPLYELNRQLGQLISDVRNLRDDAAEERRISSGFRREVREEIGGLKQQVGDLDDKLSPAVSTVAAHAKKLADHDEEIAATSIFRKRIGAIIAGGSVVATTLAGGVWYLLTAYWELILSGLRALFSSKA